MGGATRAGWKSGGNDSDKFVVARRGDQHARRMHYPEKKRFGWQPKRTRQRRVLPRLSDYAWCSFRAEIVARFASRLSRHSGCRHVNR